MLVAGRRVLVAFGHQPGIVLFLLQLSIYRNSHADTDKHWIALSRHMGMHLSVVMESDQDRAESDQDKVESGQHRVESGQLKRLEMWPMLGHFRSHAAQIMDGRSVCGGPSSASQGITLLLLPYLRRFSRIEIVLAEVSKKKAALLSEKCPGASLAIFFRFKLCQVWQLSSLKCSVCGHSSDNFEPQSFLYRCQRSRQWTNWLQLGQRPNCSQVPGGDLVEVSHAVLHH